mmetsp:Transcript_45337/g.106381  ORF Transcript_45337/g.106381 Transcript_45337/m.106381 type:complete len:220 (+) Transcript_45337:221-880(+)
MPAPTGCCCMPGYMPWPCLPGFDACSCPPGTIATMPLAPGIGMYCISSLPHLGTSAAGSGPSIAPSEGLRAVGWTPKVMFCAPMISSLPSAISGMWAGGPFFVFMFWYLNGDCCLMVFSACRSLPSRIALFFSSSRRLFSASATFCSSCIIDKLWFPGSDWRWILLFLFSFVRRSRALYALSASNRFISSICFSCFRFVTCFSNMSSLRFTSGGKPPTG